MALTKNWITENLVDFEYKKYQLLGYLQEVKENYAHTKVYPWLADPIEHYRSLSNLKAGTEQITSIQRNDVKGINWETLQLEYKSPEQESELIREIKQIINYSLPLFASTITDGKTIYDFIENKLTLKSVGITPLKTNEGYLFLNNGNTNYVIIYEYHLSFYTLEQQKFRSLSTQFVCTKSLNHFSSYEKIKQELIQENNTFPNPAVFNVECPPEVPLNETLLPIAKRFLACKIAA